MSYQKQLRSVKEFTPSRQTSALYPVFCILFFASLFLITTPPLAASDWKSAVLGAGGWAATYGGPQSDSANSIQQIRAGGYIVAGSTQSFSAGDTNFWVLKLGPDGTVEWQKTYGGFDKDVARFVQQTSDGGYIVAGSTQSFSAGDTNFWVLKLKPDGTVEWQKTYGGSDLDAALSIQQTSDGGYIVVGVTASFGAGGEETPDLWVLKLKPDGTVEWQKTYGGFGKDVAESIRQTDDGGYIVAGWTWSFGAGAADLLVLRLGPDGTVEWQKTYGGGYGDRANSIQQTGDGGCIVAGSTQSFSAGDTNFWVLKLGPDGTVEWQKTYGGDGWDEAESIQQTSDGGYIVVGGTGAFNTGDEMTFDLWVLKLGPDGTVEWQKTYGGFGKDVARSVQQTSDGGYIVAGYTGSFGPGGEGTFDLWVLKLRPDGSMDPSCDFMGNTNASGISSNALILDSSAIVRDSNASPQDSSATVKDTNVSANILCP